MWGETRGRSLRLRFSFAKTLCALYTWVLAAVMLSALPHSNGVAWGLGISGGLVLLFYGAVWIGVAWIIVRSSMYTASDYSQALLPCLSRS